MVTEAQPSSVCGLIDYVRGIQRNTVASFSRLVWMEVGTRKEFHSIQWHHKVNIRPLDILFRLTRGQWARNKMKNLYFLLFELIDAICLTLEPIGRLKSTHFGVNWSKQPEKTFFSFIDHVAMATQKSWKDDKFSWINQSNTRNSKEFEFFFGSLNWYACTVEKKKEFPRKCLNQTSPHCAWLLSTATHVYVARSNTVCLVIVFFGFFITQHNTWQT